MNAQTAKDYLPLVMALSEGKTIEYRVMHDGSWAWATMLDIDFTDPADRYRIKPEPRDFWINVYGDCVGLNVNIHPTKEMAENNASSHRKELIHVREVL